MKYNYFDEMKPFNGDISKIPNIPVLPKDVYENVVIPNLIRCGAIPKDCLKVGSIYEGRCRNSSMAKWNGKFFTYDRYKWGATYEESINHFQDDNGFDIFIPIKEIV